MLTFFVVISVVRYGPPNRTEHRIRVENISSRVSWQVCLEGGILESYHHITYNTRSCKVVQRVLCYIVV